MFADLEPQSQDEEQTFSWSGQSLYQYTASPRPRSYKVRLLSYWGVYCLHNPQLAPSHKDDELERIEHAMHTSFSPPYYAKACSAVA